MASTTLHVAGLYPWYYFRYWFLRPNRPKTEKARFGLTEDWNPNLGTLYERQNGTVLPPALSNHFSNLKMHQKKVVFGGITESPKSRWNNYGWETLSSNRPNVSLTIKRSRIVNMNGGILSMAIERQLLKLGYEILDHPSYALPFTCWLSLLLSILRTFCMRNVSETTTMQKKTPLSTPSPQEH